MRLPKSFAPYGGRSSKSRSLSRMHWPAQVHGSVKESPSKICWARSETLTPILASFLAYQKQRSIREHNTVVPGGVP